MASEAWQARNARARALGYESYYDYRMHDFGRIAADQPRLSGERGAALRGHRGYGDLTSLLASGRASGIVGSGANRGADGRFQRYDVYVTLRGGSQQFFTLRGGDASAYALGYLVDLADEYDVDEFLDYADGSQAGG